jgi:HEAT repeat protein
MDIAELIDALHSGDEVARIYAAEDIGFANDPAGVAPLVQHLQSEPSGVVRAAIFQALARIGDPAVVDAAIGLLASDDPRDRNQAVDLLQHLGGQAMPAVTRAAHSGDRDVRKLALDVLGGIATADGAELIAAKLDDPDINVVITAVEQAGLMQARQCRTRIEQLFTLTAEPMLIAACLDALGKIGDGESVRIALNHLGSISRAPRLYAPALLRLIGAHGDARDWDAVALFLIDANLPLHAAAAVDCLFALTRRGEAPPLSDPLIATLQDLYQNAGSDLVRYQAARLLARGGFPSSSASAEALMSHPDKVVRLACVEELGAAAGPDSRKALQEARQSERDEEVLQAIGSALAAIAGPEGSR